MAATKRKRKKKINPIRIFVVAVMAVLIVFCGYSVKNIIDLHAEQNELRAKNAELTQKKEDLIAELKNVNDLGYIEEQARKQLKMIRPGEVLYVIDDDGSKEAAGQSNTGGQPAAGGQAAEGRSEAAPESELGAENEAGTELSPDAETEPEKEDAPEE